MASSTTNSVQNVSFLSVQTTPVVAANVVVIQLGTTAAQLQTLINTAAADTILQLKEGHYNFDRTILVNRDNISIVGAGSGKTIIDLPSSLGEEAFQIGSARTQGAYTLSQDLEQGGTVMTLSGNHSFVAGDFVYLSRESTAAFYAEIGDTAWANTDVALRTSIAKVVSVVGAKVTLSTGAHFDFTKVKPRSLKSTWLKTSRSAGSQWITD